MSVPRSAPSSASKARLWRLLISVVVLVGSAALSLTFEPKLGLDLQGGTQFVLETQDSKTVKADAEATDRTLTVLRGRVDALGVSEPTIARSGENRIIVELPGVQDPEEARSAIGQTAQLRFHEVLGPAEKEPDPQNPPEPGAAGVYLDEDGTPIKLGESQLDGNGVDDASAGQPQNQSNWVVNVQFNSNGVEGWRALVNAACANIEGGQRIAITLDQNVISSPQVQPDLCAGPGSQTSITGNFTIDSATELATLIKGGSLPVPVEFVEERTIGPTLGEAAIDASVEAAVIGLILTGLFIVIMYRLVGFLAALALTSYALISFGLLVWLGATLTLPGLAGFVLAIGLAIDANVLVFERGREEYFARQGEGLTRAMNTGFNKAWSAILDSNVTTIIAAALLFFLASGPVRGFGVTLTIGTIASMVSALIIARTLTELVLSRSFVAKRPRISGIANRGRIRDWLEHQGPDIMKRSGTWILVTIAVAVISVGGIVVRGVELGVEFTGGRLLEYSAGKEVAVEDVRDAVAEAGFPSAVVQESSSDGADNITVRTSTITNEEAAQIGAAVSEAAGDVEQVRDEQVGPSMGKELRNKAILAFIIAIGGQMLYLAWRFRWTYALAAQLSMASVVLTVIGFFTWTGREIDGVFLAAILSVIGLAVNDTIVVFDRIREHTGENRKRPLRSVVNEAILLTIPRTVNTGLGAMFILAALAVLGGDSLSNFSIALVLGLGVGILSTVFTASSLAVLLEERWPHDPDKERRKVVDPYADVEVGGRNLAEP